MITFEGRGLPSASGMLGPVLRRPEEMGRLNERVALSALFESPDLTARELSEATGLSKVTAFKVFRHLADRGLVEFGSMRQGGPGPNATVHALRGSAAFVVALQTSSWGASAQCVDLRGVVRSSVTWPRRESTSDVEELHSLISTAAYAAGAPSRSLMQVVVGLPAVGDLDGAELARVLRGRLEVDVEVASSMAMAGAAEATTGAATDAGDFLLIYLADAVSISAVIDGTVRVGHSGGTGLIVTGATGALSAGKLVEQLCRPVVDACRLIDPSVVVVSGDAHGSPQAAIAAALGRPL